MNEYFDMLLIHGDSSFVPLDESFSRLKDIQCETKYTGYVVQEFKYNPELSTERSRNNRIRSTLNFS